VIDIVAGLITRADGHLLLVRKFGTALYMQPGGKREAGESDAAALRREVAEELSCTVDPDSIVFLAHLEGPAALEPGETVRAALYRASIVGEVTPAAEIAEAIWVHPSGAALLPLAPLTRDGVLPLAETDA